MSVLAEKYHIDPWNKIESRTIMDEETGERHHLPPMYVARVYTRLPCGHRIMDAMRVTQDEVAANMERGALLDMIAAQMDIVRLSMDNAVANHRCEATA